MAAEDEGQSLWKELGRLVAELRPEELQAFLSALPASEAARALSRLDEEDRARLLTALPPGQAATLVEQMPEVQAAAAIEDLDPGAAAAILHELSSAVQADLLGEMEDREAEAILAAMLPEDASGARALRLYADDVAGGLMVTEYMAYPQEFTVSQVVEDFRDHAELYRDYVVQYAFVTGRDGELLGVLRLRDLLLARAEQSIRELMRRDPLTVKDTATLDDLRVFFDRHHFFGVPVVDKASRLVGIVRRSAVEEARADRSDSDYLKSLGIVGGEELRTMPLLLRSRRRLAWLSVNIVLNVIAASVIALYHETLAAVIALAVFLPIISDMSGCSGNQAVAVSMRELALGLVRPAETLRVWLKELAVGALNGVALGLLIAAVAWLWKGNLYLGLVVGVAMTVNTIVAVSIGGTVPLVLRRLGFDPALASGPILTTITDMCGFFLILSLATALLPWLAGA